MTKNKYLIGIIVMGLVALSLYSTYALTTDISGDITDLSYEFNINESKSFVVEAGKKMNFNAVVKNQNNGPIKYGIYHDFDTNSNANVQIGELVSNSNAISTSPNGTGRLDSDASKIIPIAIINNSDSSITVNFEVITGYASNTITNQDGKYLITNTIDDDLMDKDSCVGEVEYNEEDCFVETVNGMIYKKCTITIGERPDDRLDKSGANEPDLIDGMIPITHNGTTWIKADSKNKNSEYKWHDYVNQMWANAVMVATTSTTNTTLSDGTACTGTNSYCTREDYMNADLGVTIPESDILAYYVWIPRYRYQLFNVNSTSMSPIEIQVEFENIDTTASTGSTNGTWLTHPAFTFGATPLSGIWVGKFETTGSATTPTIKPNAAPLISQKISVQFTTSQKFMTTTYLTEMGISELDAHMMKNTEWGAVAYLKQSKYGLGNTNIGMNNYYSSGLKTGCGAAAGSTVSSTCNAYNTTNGMLASTTGNIYGVYDMSGGALEYVMGVMLASGNSSILYSESGFTASTLPFNSKYVDQYKYSASEVKMGDATGETQTWYSDSNALPNTSATWYSRGGREDGTTTAGIFYYYRSYGRSNSKSTFRQVVVPILD